MKDTVFTESDQDYDLSPVDAEELANSEISVKARPLARMLMLKELQQSGRSVQMLDDRDMRVFVQHLEIELQTQIRMKKWPYVVYEEFGRKPKPRTPHLIEALTYFFQTGRPAIILDRQATGKRNGYIAELAVLM